MSQPHIVLTLHGLDGFDTDLDFIKLNLQKRYPNLIFMNAVGNHKKTYDGRLFGLILGTLSYNDIGILAGGKRILQEFKDLVKEQEIENAFISVIGHSLGGLYGRCFLGLLFQEGLIPSKFTPICYISLATPHLGSREHGRLLGNAITGMVLSTAIGTTGAELMLYDTNGCINHVDVEIHHGNNTNIHDNAGNDNIDIHDNNNAANQNIVDIHDNANAASNDPNGINQDNDSNGNNNDQKDKADIPEDHGDKVPFLVELSTPRWTNVLKLFKRLVCYSNTRYDVSVHYSTAAIRAPGSTFTPPTKIHVYPAILDDSNPEPVPTGMDYESIMLRGLGSLDWKRYAVVPSRPFLAHIDIIVKSVWLNHRYGIAIVSHIIDHFRSLPTTKPKVHLILLLTETSSRDLLPLIESIRDKYPRPFYKVTTLDMGEKIYDKLLYQLDHSNATKLSIIGHGVGGLLSRWVIGMLAGKDIELVNLVCIDTPHLSMGLPQTTFWKNGDIAEQGDETRMVDLITSDEYIKTLSKFSNLVLYASTKDPSLSLQSGLLLDSPDAIGGLGSGVSTIVSIDHTGSEKGISSLPWKRFAIVQAKSVKLCLYWNDAEHPIHGHLTNELVG